MQKKASISEEQREKLDAELKEAGITRAEIAKESSKSIRSVMYFFSGRSYSRDIHYAAIRLLQHRSSNEMIRLVEKQQLITTLI